ncbi:MAG: phage terminase large subunit family protein [Alphaproteobacteria bacterium]|jgi:phage terminase large subunit GpA-like protein|nr:phage terminase large subunit family protein [Alphaproteobacteria bacterium]
MMPRLREEALPPFVTAAAVRRAAASALRPPRRITISECAEKHRHVRNKGGGYSGPWRNSLTPYLVEPMDRQLRRDTDMVVIIGPAQFGKTEIFLNTIAHAALYAPRDILLIQPSRSLAQDFSERRIEQGLLNTSPDVKAQIGESRGDDKVFTKTFKNGSMVTLGYPVSGELASRPVPFVLIDERDSIDDDIGGEGDPIVLARKRTTQFGKNGIITVVSSPKREDITKGIVPLFFDGDRNLWWWPCLDCGEYWSPGFDADQVPTIAHLRILPDATPDQAASMAALICPHCGALTEAERHRTEMRSRGLWLPYGMGIRPSGDLIGVRPVTRVGSYWLSGLVNAFKPLADTVHAYVTALRKYERTGDETDLKAEVNTTLGVYYKSKAVTEAEQLEPGVLKERAEAFPLGVVPARAGAIFGTVDVQMNSFVVAIWAVAATGEFWLVAYFDIFKAVEVDGIERQISPATNGADWDVLTDQVVLSRWPVEGTEDFMSPTLTMVDTGGKKGATGNAYEWWIRASRYRDAAGLRVRLDRSIMLTKGGNRPDAPLITRSLIETDNRGRRLKKGVKLYILNVHALKDIASSRLQVAKPGANYVHFSLDTPDRVYAELCAEVRTEDDGWQKRSPRNEAWDLFVQLLAAWVRKGGPKIDPASPPSWLRQVATAEVSPQADDRAVAEGPAQAAVRPVTLPAKRKKRRGFLGDMSHWGQHA